MPTQPGFMDFELEIRSGAEGEYTIAARCLPLGEGQETIRLGFREGELESFLDGIQRVMLAAREIGVVRPPPGAAIVQQFGQRLFESVFTGRVRDLYERSQNEAENRGQTLRLRLAIEPPELAAWPWEYLYDPRHGQNEYLCLANRSIVRYLKVMTRTQPLWVRPPLRILGLVAAPSDLPGLDTVAEQRWMEHALRDLHHKGQVELSWAKGQTWRHLQEAMQHGPWHVFHFIGHGGFDRAAGEGTIALANEVDRLHILGARQLSRLLVSPNADKALRLVVLNSCSGAQASQEDVFSSTAAALMSRGVPAVLAMQYRISDRAAIGFARTFYGALAAGSPVDTAVTQARAALSMESRETAEWGTPVLYMRSPDGRLFDMAPRPGPKEQPREDAAARSGWHSFRKSFPWTAGLVFAGVLTLALRHHGSLSLHPISQAEQCQSKVEVLVDHCKKGHALDCLRAAWAYDAGLGVTHDRNKAQLLYQAAWNSHERPASLVMAAVGALRTLCEDDQDRATTFYTTFCEDRGQQRGGLLHEFSEQGCKWINGIYSQDTAKELARAECEGCQQQPSTPGVSAASRDRECACYRSACDRDQRACVVLAEERPECWKGTGQDPLAMSCQAGVAVACYNLGQRKIEGDTPATSDEEFNRRAGEAKSDLEKACYLEPASREACIVLKNYYRNRTINYPDPEDALKLYRHVCRLLDGQPCADRDLRERAIRRMR